MYMCMSTHGIKENGVTENIPELCFTYTPTSLAVIAQQVTLCEPRN